VMAGLAIAALLLLASLHAQTSPPPRLTPDDLFDQNTVQDILLTVNSSDWTALKEHYLENVYYVADLRWRGEVVRNVGIRSRGRGSRSESKPGLRVDFNRYTSGQQFLGLKSLVLDNLTQDPSMLKERVVMRFFTEMGMPAPRVVHARLFVNNAFAGLYTIVESIDKDFLGRTLNENDGYLYEFKHTDPYGFEYLGSELEKYAEFFEPKTHENDSMA
jgi:spore coat protein CotH